MNVTPLTAEDDSPIKLKHTSIGARVLRYNFGSFLSNYFIHSDNWLESRIDGLS